MSDTARSRIFFFETVHASSFLLNIVPFLNAQDPSRRAQLYVFEVSGGTLLIANCVLKMMGRNPLRICTFDLASLRDERGVSVRLRLACEDTMALQTKIEKILDGFAVDGTTAGFHEKKFISKNVLMAEYLGPAKHYQFIHVMTMLWGLRSWRAANPEAGEMTLVCQPRMFQEVLCEYASGMEVRLAFVRLLMGRRGGLLRETKDMAQKVIKTVLAAGNALFAPRQERAISDCGYLVGADYYGHLNLRTEGVVSDLFFLNGSTLKPCDVGLVFHIGQDPLDEAKRRELAAIGLHPVVRSLRALKNPLSMRLAGGEVPEVVTQWFPTPERTLDEAVTSQKKKFEAAKRYWVRFFRSSGIRVHTQWYKYDASHMPMAMAMEELGGVMTLYQRAFESHPSAETVVTADIVFSFSPRVAAVERANGSFIRYHVTTGYLGDYRFQALRPLALKLRADFALRGFKKIIAFLDENTMDDGRWFTGHNFTRENYAFLLEKVMERKDIGIVIKPKAPHTLVKRLGPVAKLLKSAERTGCCFVFGDGVLQGSYPPAAAAMAADVTVHEVLSAGTAGMEAALSGARTVLLDREGWPDSPLYALGKGQSVFTGWDELWEAVEGYLENPSSRPGLGDWSLIIKDLDPFNDGQAARRMGNYLKVIIEALRRGDPKVDVLERAADVYAREWGKDKITRDIRSSG